MRREDIERLSVPYTNTELADRARLGKALGVDLPRTRALADAILADFDEGRLGIGWWAPSPGAARRILISDQLYLCVSSVDENLAEARIHLMEAAEAAELRDQHVATAVIGEPPRVRFRPPRMKSAADDMVAVRFKMHILGCVRGIASALDCFGATIVGVLGLRTPILTAGYASAMQVGADAKRSNGFQTGYVNRIKDSIAAAGPRGWDAWVIALRNMLVHRGRRMWMNKIVATGSRFFAPGLGEVLGSRVVTLLPSDPARSDVEVMREASEAGLVLTEDAFETLESAITSARSALENGAGLLHNAWMERRSNPSRTVMQPAEQWPKPTKSDKFEGYRPGSVAFDPTEFHTNPVFGVRLKAASLEDSTRHRWSTFD